MLYKVSPLSYIMASDILEIRGNESVGNLLVRFRNGVTISIQPQQGELLGPALDRIAQEINDLLSGGLACPLKLDLACQGDSCGPA